MMVVSSPSRKIEAALADTVASTSVEFSCVYKIWIEYGESPGYGTTVGTISGTTPATLVPAPTGGRVHEVESLIFHNADSTSVTVNFRQDESATDNTFMQVSVPSGYTLSYSDKNGFQVRDTTGSLLQSSVPTSLVLWHCDGTDGDTSSPWTPDIGNPPLFYRATAFGELDTAITKFGTASYRMPSGGNRRLETYDGSPWTPNLSDQSFSWDFWFYVVASGTPSLTWALHNSTGTGTFACQFLLDFSTGTNNVYSLIYESDGTTPVIDHYTTAQDSYTFSNDTWYHFALQRDRTSGHWTMWIDGTVVWDVANDNTTLAIQGMQFNSGTGGTDVHFEEIRLTNATPYTYNTAFTPETAAYTR